MRRRRLLVSGVAAGAGVAAVGALTLRDRPPEPAPADAMSAVADVPQPQEPSQGPEQDPSSWRSVNFSGVSFSLLSSLEGPSPHRDWGLYAVSYDKAAPDGFEQRVMVSAVDTTTTADGLRQTVDLVNSGLITSYTEIGRVSWKEDEGAAFERVAFYWGSAGTRCGWTWMLATGVGTGVVTLLGTSVDDGLRNGIEATLSLVRRSS